MEKISFPICIEIENEIRGSKVNKCTCQRNNKRITTKILFKSALKVHRPEIIRIKVRKITRADFR